MEANNVKAMREAIVDIKTGLAGKMEQSPALMTPHEVAILKRCEAALAEPPRECDMFADEKQADALHEAFIEYCDGCDCPVGCDHRKNPRFLLDTNCASIMKCFARFALSRKAGKK